MGGLRYTDWSTMKGEQILSAEEVRRICNTPAVRQFLDYMAAQEARPRVACPDCQFEYVEEDGHDCGEREVQT